MYHYVQVTGGVTIHDNIFMYSIYFLSCVKERERGRKSVLLFEFPPSYMFNGHHLGSDPRQIHIHSCTLKTRQYCGSLPLGYEF